jgi:hypothetical protein
MVSSNGESAAPHDYDRGWLSHNNLTFGKVCLIADFFRFKSKSKLSYNWCCWPVSPGVRLLGPVTNLLFSIFFKLPSDKCERVIMGCPIWQENESVAVGLNQQSLSRQNSKGLMTKFYCLKFQTPPNLKEQVPILISPQEQGAQLWPMHLVYLIHLHVIIYL